MTANTDRLVSGVVESLMISVDDLAVDLVCPSSVISQAASCCANIALGYGKCLTVVKCFDRGKRIDFLFKKIRELGQQSASICGSGRVPNCVESFSCGGHSDVDI